MALPSQVQAQLEKVNTMIGDLAKATPISNVIVDSPHGNPTPPASNPAGATPAPAPAPQPDSFEHKYNVLQGKYNNEISAFKRRLDDQERTITNLNTLLVERSAAQAPGRAKEPDEIPPQETPQAPKTSTGFSKMKKEEFEGYGDEMIAMVETVNKMADVIQTLRDERDSHLKDRVAEGFNAFVTGLTALVPDWQEYNNDAGFLAWLAEKDTAWDEQTRQEKLNGHVAKGNAQAAAQFFKTYKGTLGAHAKPTEQPPANPKADLVTPTPGASSGEPVNMAPKTYTLEDLTKATDDFIHKRITQADWEKVTRGFHASRTGAKSA
jgi:hypothetical protein